MSLFTGTVNHLDKITLVGIIRISNEDLYGSCEFVKSYKIHYKKDFIGNHFSTHPSHFCVYDFNTLLITNH